MDDPIKKKLGYNERLFGGSSIRSYLHNSRFIWFQNKLEQLNLPNINMLEIGCFDGRLIKFCPDNLKRYVGLDADWEGGLSIAQKEFKNHPDWKFYKAENATSLKEFSNDTFNVGAMMETIEHIPPALVDDYLNEMARTTNGWVFITVPNEKGIVFLLKYLVMKFIMRSAQDYTMKEIIAATLGQMQKIERCEHKGFDYDILIKQVSKKFEIVKVQGIPFKLLPISLSFTIGIIARSKKQ